MRTRRDLVKVASGIALGTTGLALTSRESQALGVEIDGLSVPDKTRGVSNDVKAVQLGVDGQYRYSTGTVPTRLVLRLEARPLNSEWSQIDAQAFRDLDESQSGEYSLQGNLMKHPNLNASLFTPSERGESKTVQIEIRVKMSLRNENGVLGEKQAKDDASITVEKTGVSVSLGLSGNGSIGVTTVE